MGVVKIRCSIISTIWCKYKCKAFQIQQEVILTIFFFFLYIRMIYIRKSTLCMKNIEQTQKYKKKKTKKNHNRKPNNKIITKEKGSKEKKGGNH